MQFEEQAGTANDNDSEDRRKSLGSASDNIIKPFMLESSDLRGRLVRVGGVLDTLLGAHDYPEPVAKLVAETLTLALLLSSMLKYNGIFTLQTQSKGAVKMLVADVTSEGKARACASFDAEQLTEALKTGSDLETLLGTGHVAFTVDQGPDTDRYQGIVELKGESLVDCVRHYFQQSEQIATGIKIAAGIMDGEWRAAGIMLQNMPEEGGHHAEPLTSAEGNVYPISKFDSSAENADDTQENWLRANIFLDSCKTEEFLDPTLHPNDLLQRLFGEEGVRVFEPREIIWECRCSPERVETMLGMMSEDDRAYMDVDGSITMKCEFCSREYVFDTQEIERNISKDSDKTAE